MLQKAVISFLINITKSSCCRRLLFILHTPGPLTSVERTSEQEMGLWSDRYLGSIFVSFTIDSISSLHKKKSNLACLLDFP